MTERPRLRADLLAERADGVVEMMAPDGVAVLQLYDVEAAVACGMDGSRDATALVVWARLELGLAVTEGEIRAVMAALAAAGCLAEGDADLANAASPFDSMPAIRTAAVIDTSRTMSAEIQVEDVELPEPGPDMGGDTEDEDDAGADEFRDEPTLTTPPEVLARAAEDAAAAAAAAAAATAGSGQRAASSRQPPAAAIAATKPPTRDTPRGYEAIAAAVKASVAGKPASNAPRPAPITAPPPMAQPQKRKRESIPPLDKTKTLRPEPIGEDDRPTLSPDAEPPAVAAAPQLFTTMRGQSPFAPATAPTPAPLPAAPIPTAMMPSVGRLPALSQTLRPEPIDSPTLRPEDDFDIDHTGDDVVTLPPANEPPVGDPVGEHVNSPSDTIGGMVAPRFCMSCGIELLAGVRFCVACGTPVVNMLSDVETEPPPLEPPPAAPPPAIVTPPPVAPPPVAPPPVAPVVAPGPPSHATPRRLEAPAMRTPVAVAIPPRASSQPSPSSPPPLGAAAPPAVAPQRASMPVLRRSSLLPILVAIGLVALAAAAAFVLWQR